MEGLKVFVQERICVMKAQINSEVTQTAEMFSKLPVEAQDEILSLMRSLVAQNKKNIKNNNKTEVVVMLNGEKANEVEINVDEIPQSEINVCCSVIASSIKRLFKNPEIRAEYEAWLKSPEGQKARERSCYYGAICNL